VDCLPLVQAGIQRVYTKGIWVLSLLRKEIYFLNWIPACVGMTVENVR
jgi:hypothetical protein